MELCRHCLRKLKPPVSLDSRWSFSKDSLSAIYCDDCREKRKHRYEGYVICKVDGGYGDGLMDGLDIDRLIAVLNDADSLRGGFDVDWICDIKKAVLWFREIGGQE